MYSAIIGESGAPSGLDGAAPIWQVLSHDARESQAQAGWRRRQAFPPLKIPLLEIGEPFAKRAEH